MKNDTSLTHAVRPMALERVLFSDGMILTADDLEAERRYHLDRSRMINRGVFGCGIACGLGVERHPEDDKKTRFVCVHPGIAIDCHGDPLELCRPVKLDLDPDPCKEPPDRVCILIRRRCDKPTPADRCCKPCPPDDGPRRVREEVELCVIDASARDSIGDLCWNPPSKPNDGESEGPTLDSICACLKTCEACDDCCEGWVLLACVDLKKPGSAGKDDKGTLEDRDRWSIVRIDLDGRKYIKPTHCLCSRMPYPRDDTEDPPSKRYVAPKTKPRPSTKPKPKPRGKPAG